MGGVRTGARWPSWPTTTWSPACSSCTGCTPTTSPRGSSRPWRRCGRSWPPRRRRRAARRRRGRRGGAPAPAGQLRRLPVVVGRRCSSAVEQAIHEAAPEVVIIDVEARDPGLVPAGSADGPACRWPWGASRVYEHCPSEVVAARPPDEHRTPGAPPLAVARPDPARPGGAPGAVGRASAARCAPCRSTTEHGHLVDLEQPGAALRLPGLLPAVHRDGAGGGRFRAVPDRYLSVPRASGCRAGAVGRAADPGERGLLLRQLQPRRGWWRSTRARRGPPSRCCPSTPGTTRRGQPRARRPSRPTSRRSWCAPSAAARRECFLCPSTPATSWSGQLRTTWRGFDGGADAHDGPGRVLRPRPAPGPPRRRGPIAVSALRLRGGRRARRALRGAADAAAAPADRRDDRARPCTRWRCAARCASSRSAGATTTGEEHRLYELFGPTPQWGESLRPFLWTHVGATVPGFTGATEFDLPVPCTYDFEVAAAKYLHALGDGVIPLVLLFSGTVFSRGERGFVAEPVAWHAEASFRLPVATWRAVMDRYFPDSGWVRVDRATLDRLQRYKAERALPTWDEAVDRLLERRGRGAVTHCPPARPPTGSRSPGPSPTPCSTRATCCTPTGRRRGRTRCGGSSACCAPPVGRGRRLGAVGEPHRGARRPRRRPRLHVRVRCLQVQDRARRGRRRRRRLRARGRAAGRRRSPTSAFGEAVEHEVDLPAVALLPLAGAHARRASPSTWPARTRGAGRRRRRHGGRAGRATPGARDRAGAGGGAVGRRPRRARARSAVEVENTVRRRRPAPPAATRPWPGRWSPCTRCWRSTTAASSACSSRPAFAAEAAAGCRSEGTYPVLVGEPGSPDADVVLSSPIILYDHPAVAPESQGDMFDATEIDEILALRVLTLTDDEKAEARGTDRRAAAIVDRCDDLPPEVWARLHGAIRSIGPATRARRRGPAPCRGGTRASTRAVDPFTDTVVDRRAGPSAGARQVVLRPSRAGRRPRPVPRRPAGHRGRRVPRRGRRASTSR